MKLVKKYLFFPIILFVLVIALKFIFGLFPDFLATVYQHGLFPIIRILYDYLIGWWLPFPMLWISVGIIIYMIFIRRYHHPNIKSLLAQITGHVLVVFSFFYILWGWNYAQRSIASSLQLESIAVDTSSLYKEAVWAVDEINKLRAELQNDTLPLDYSLHSRHTIERGVRDHLSITLKKIGLSAYGRPRIRVLKPKGILLRFKTAGIYMPYAFEGHIDGGLLPLEWPYTMSHEMSHSYGITDEGECNFTAFLACMNSDDSYFQYSAMIDYILYVMRDVYRSDKQKHKEIFSLLHKGFKADLKAMRENNHKYPDILPAVRDFMYDSYLKSNGVKAGLKSYSQLVGLVIAYKTKYGSLSPMN